MYLDSICRPSAMITAVTAPRSSGGGSGSGGISDTSVVNIGLFVTSGADKTIAVAAILASAEPIRCPARALSFRMLAQVEHNRLSEWSVEKSDK